MVNRSVLFGKRSAAKFEFTIASLSMAPKRLVKRSKESGPITRRKALLGGVPPLVLEMLAQLVLKRV